MQFVCLFCLLACFLLPHTRPPVPSCSCLVYYCIGDAENDVEMLRLAGVGVCVGNASPPAKAAARFVAPTNAEDGSAVAMEQLLRNKRPSSGEE